MLIFVREVLLLPLAVLAVSIVFALTSRAVRLRTLQSRSTEPVGALWNRSAFDDLDRAEYALFRIIDEGKGWSVRGEDDREVWNLSGDMGQRDGWTTFGLRAKVTGDFLGGYAVEFETPSRLMASIDGSEILTPEGRLKVYWRKGRYADVQSESGELLGRYTAVDDDWLHGARVVAILKAAPDLVRCLILAHVAAYSYGRGLPGGLRISGIGHVPPDSL